MTFAEAAIEVLYRAGRPLHYKKITEAAINEELLAHVGRTPEETMGERLVQEAKKQGENITVESVRPGVYKLSDTCTKKLEAEGRERLPLGKKKKKPVATNGKADASVEASGQNEAKGRDSNDKASGSRRRRRSRRSGDSDSSNSHSRGRRRSSRKSKSKSSGRRRKSNRRSSRNSRKSSSSRRSSSRRKSSRNKSSRRSEREPRRDRDDRRRGRRSSKKNSEQTRRSSRKPSRSQLHLEEGPVLLDAIAQAALTVLADNSRKPMKVSDLAEEIFDRKLVKFHTHDGAATVQSALAGDNQVRERAGNRPLFIRYDRSRWGLTSWGLSEDSVDREQSILSLAEEIRQDAVKTLGRALTDVKAEALEHLTLTLLQRMGYRDLKVSKRSSDGDVFFTSDWRQGLADARVCIQVIGDTDTELEAGAVTDLRGTLHHYSASEGVIIHLGEIDDDAVAESREDKLATITLLDRDTFVELLIKHGIGVRTYQAPITMVDTSFLDAIASA